MFLGFLRVRCRGFDGFGGSGVLVAMGFFAYFAKSVVFRVVDLESMTK